MKLTRYLIPAFVAAPAAFGLFTAPPAIAECNSSGYATVCAQGDVRGGSAAPVTGPVDPYPCDDDWMCSDGVDINWGPIWRPGRPGGPGGPGGPASPLAGGSLWPHAAMRKAAKITKSERRMKSPDLTDRGGALNDHWAPFIINKHTRPSR